MRSGKKCFVCGMESPLIAGAIGVCSSCIETNFPEVRLHIEKNHADSRCEFKLPGKPPRHRGGVACDQCANACVIGEHEMGFCGLRTVHDGTLEHRAGTPQKGFLSWYRDQLPTNCVGDWVCEGSKHHGYHNLAVFYQSCSANCLFCQNWHFRASAIQTDNIISAGKLASEANSSTFCVCFFGGDPATQMPHALETSRQLMEKGVLICWETSGLMSSRPLQTAVEYSFQSGGCIKFDLKAFDENLHLALTGVSNRQIRKNFIETAKKYPDRKGRPLVIASTLLVPGYVNARQVEKIAGFIASINPEIPYSLLAFAPLFFMSDLPRTTLKHALEAESAARHAGLKNVRLGNRHLLT